MCIEFHCLGFYFSSCQSRFNKLSRAPFAPSLFALVEPRLSPLLRVADHPVNTCANVFSYACRCVQLPQYLPSTGTRLIRAPVYIPGIMTAIPFLLQPPYY